MKDEEDLLLRQECILGRLQGHDHLSTRERIVRKDLKDVQEQGLIAMLGKGPSSRWRRRSS